MWVSLQELWNFKIVIGLESRGSLIPPPQKKEQIKEDDEEEGQEEEEVEGKVEDRRENSHLMGLSIG